MSDIVRLPGRRHDPPDHQQPDRLHHVARSSPARSPYCTRRGQDGPGADLPRERRRPRGLRARGRAWPSSTARRSTRTSSSTWSATAATATTRATTRATRSRSCTRPSTSGAACASCSSRRSCKRGELTLDEAEAALADFQRRLQVALDETRADARRRRSRPPSRRRRWACCPTSRPASTAPCSTRSSTTSPPTREGFTPHPKLVPPVRDPGQAVPRGAARSSGPRPRRWPSARWCSRAPTCAWPARTAAGARSASATPRLVDYETERAWMPLQRPARRHGQVLGLRLAAVGVRRRRASSTATRSPTRTRWCCGRRSSATSSTAPRSSSTSTSWPPRTSGARRPASSCCCPTASRARAPSTRSARIERFLTLCRRGQHPGRATPRPRRSTSTCCGARCAATSASRWSCSRRSGRCA